tara:strand:+ start:362 stop:871 length:510 start_codon:yes stop_codon:yes gene_type:complete
MDNIQTQTNVRSGSIEAKDPFAQSIPGTSLTSENKKWAWGNPPEMSDPDVVLQEATDRLDDPRFRGDMMKLLLAGVSVEHIVETWVIDGFESGKFSLDVGLLTKGPLGVYIAYIAEEEDVAYRMFEKDDGGMNKDRIDDESLFTLMKNNNPAMFETLREELNSTIRKGK